MFAYVQYLLAMGAFACATVAICVVIEWISPIEKISLRDRIPGALMVFVGSSLAIVAAWPLQKLWGMVGLKGWIVPLADWTAPLGGLGAALSIGAFFLCNDFLGYWRHRAEHRWFWPIHAVHHSPRELHAANAIGHPLQIVPMFILQTIPLSLIQIQTPAIPLFVALIAGLLEVYIHASADVHFGPMRRVFVDNRFHRIHHSLEERHFDRNFGIMFSLWDSMFRTAYWPAKDEWPATGLSDLEPPRTVTQFLMLPFASFLPRRLGEVHGDPAADS